MQPLTSAMLLVVCVCAAGCQSSDKARDAQVIAIPDLGFRYTPPAGMTDNTSDSAKQARDHAAAYAAKAAALILDLTSGNDDTSPDWHQVWMFIYPRAGLSNLDDAAAEAKMNTALAGPRATSAGRPESANVAGHTFLLSEFEQKEPPLTRHARIYTAICKAQLVSFVFVSNSAEQLKRMEESLKSLDFSAK